MTLHKALFESLPLLEKFYACNKQKIPQSLKVICNIEIYPMRMLAACSNSNKQFYFSSKNCNPRLKMKFNTQPCIYNVFNQTLNNSLTLLYISHVCEGTSLTHLLSCIFVSIHWQSALTCFHS